MNLLRSIVCGLFALFGLAVPAAAQPSLPRPITGDDVAAYMNGFVPSALDEADMAGAVVMVVKDGRIIFDRGYGYADIVNRVPVDPDRTLFRIASIAKLFTWTAVMQLVEQGKIDLDADVNRYLDFKISRAFDKPITMRHLMTHTAGFEEQLKGMFFSTPDRLLPLGEAVRLRLPRRIFAPGTVTAYSNYGATLAGYIVERVSGEPFERYAERHLFGPLGMKSTTFIQPLPVTIGKRLSEAYFTRSDPPRERDYLQLWPGGSAVSTGPDMARFMIAQLEAGRYEGRQILRPETVALMQRRASTIAPGTGLNSWTLGFWEETRNGERVVAHGGNINSFHPYLHLIPGTRTGIFVALNSSGNGDHISFRLRLFRGFMDRYFPLRDVPAPAEIQRADAAELVGTYLSSRRSESSFLRIGNLWDQPKLIFRSDGTIEFDGYRDLDGSASRWQPIGTDMWKEVDGPGRLAVVRNRTGGVAYLTADIYPPTSVYQPTRFIEGGRWMLPAYWAALATLLLGALYAGLRLIKRDRSRTMLLVAGTSSINALVLATWPYLVKNLPDTAFNESLDPALWLLQALAVIGILGTLLLIATIFRHAGSLKLGAAASGLLLLVANLTAFGFAWVFHLLALPIRY